MQYFRDESGRVIHTYDTRHRFLEACKTLLFSVSAVKGLNRPLTLSIDSLDCHHAVSTLVGGKRTLFTLSSFARMYQNQSTVLLCFVKPFTTCRVPACTKCN